MLLGDRRLQRQDGAGIRRVGSDTGGRSLDFTLEHGRRSRRDAGAGQQLVEVGVRTLQQRRAGGCSTRVVCRNGDLRRACSFVERIDRGDVKAPRL